MSARQTLQRYASVLAEEEGPSGKGPATASGPRHRPASASQAAAPGVEDELGALLASVDERAGELESGAAPIPTGPSASRPRTTREPERPRPASGQGASGAGAGAGGDSRAHRLSQAKSEEMARFREAARSLMAQRGGRRRPSKEQVRRVALRVSRGRDVAGAVDAESRRGKGPAQASATNAASASTNATAKATTNAYASPYANAYVTSAPQPAQGQARGGMRQPARRVQRRAPESTATRVRARASRQAGQEEEEERGGRTAEDASFHPIRTSPLSHDTHPRVDGAGGEGEGECGGRGAESLKPLSEPPQSPLLSPARHGRASAGVGRSGSTPKQPAPRPAPSGGAVHWEGASGRRQEVGGTGAAGATPRSVLRPRVRTPGASEDELDSTIGSGWSAQSPRSTLQRSPFSALEQTTSTPQSADDRSARRARGARSEASARESTASSQGGTGLGPRPAAAADDDLQIADAAREQLAALEADLAALTPLSSTSSASGFHGHGDEGSPRRPRR